MAIFLRNNIVKAIYLLLFAALVLYFSVSTLASSGCPEGTVRIGEHDVRVGNTIYVHPICQTIHNENKRTYIPSGNGLVGGVSWIIGYNVQNADTKLVAEERSKLLDQMRLAKLPYDDAIDFKRYNFVIGIAASTNKWVDLLKRAIPDEYSNGQFSASEQAAYASLTGRSFNELACHSNGAMVCLAALMNKDVIADHVVLYGPQITAESLQLWNNLVASGEIKSVQVIINESDPVPPVSLMFGDASTFLHHDVALFIPVQLSKTITSIAPKLQVRMFACGDGLPTLKCHEMISYRYKR